MSARSLDSAERQYDQLQIQTDRMSIIPSQLALLEGQHFLNDLHAIYDDSATTRYLALPGNTYNRIQVAELIEEEADAWKQGQRALWLFVESTQCRAVGIAKIQQSPMPPPDDVEVVCAIHPAFRNRGYAEEGLRALLGNNSITDGVRVIARISATNKASGRLVKSLGFRYERQFDDLIDGSQEVWAYPGVS